MKLFKQASAAVALVALSSVVSAAEILPVDYSFDKSTDTGSYAYHDWTGNQLTDGAYGVAPWWADLGNGNAYEWLGWVYDTPVNIDFDFGGATSIDSINVGSVQDHPNDVVFPNIYIYSSADALSWSLLDFVINPESTSNNNTYQTFQFDQLSINDQYVRVSLVHSWNGPWTFVDEIDFFQNTPVPEPSTLALFSLALLGFGLSRRRA